MNTFDEAIAEEVIEQPYLVPRPCGGWIDLPAMAGKINEEFSLARRARGASSVDSVYHRLHCGWLLTEVKSSLPYGLWLNWFNNNCHFHITSATRMMRAARKYQQSREPTFEEAHQLIGEVFFAEEGTGSAREPEPENAPTEGRWAPLVGWAIVVGWVSAICAAAVLLGGGE